MAFWSMRRKFNRVNWRWLLGLALAAPVGCGGNPGNGGDAGKPGAAAPTAQAQPKDAGPTAPNIVQVAFLDATLQEPPGEEQRPPDMTKAGKSIGKIYEAIAGSDGQGGLWEQVKFVAPTGKKLHYSATLKTSAGIMKMELFPDIAPNHVRNFVALARAGYYDGLSFDRAVKQAISAEDYVQYVEAGCPLGTGESGYGSIGYWMKAEVSDKVRHEPGTVGAWHEEGEVDSAGCKFYITLNRAEALDKQYTVFGKITQGLEVVHTIYDSPRAKDSVNDRLERSVVIEQVVIHTEEQ